MRVLPPFGLGKEGFELLGGANEADSSAAAPGRSLEKERITELFRPFLGLVFLS
jgi:hypothetical protein